MQEIAPTTPAQPAADAESEEPWRSFVRQSDAFSCRARVDGFYASRWCNVFYRCANGARFEFQCARQLSGDRLWWGGPSRPGGVDADLARCAYPCEIDRACSSPGGLLVEAGTDEKKVFFLSNGKLLWIL